MLNAAFPPATLVLALLAGLSTTGAWAGDVAQGRIKAQACAVCHGPQGIATAPDAPHLAGQSAIYTATQLKAYRSGERRHAVMAVMAKPLSDADIDDLAAWFAAIRIEATPP